MLENQLGDLVPNSYFKVCVAEIEENSDRASVIGADDAGADVEAELGSESAARSDAAVCPFRDGNRNLGVNERFASGGNDTSFGAVKIMTGCLV